MENPYQWPRIIFFDGVCILCNGSVDFLLKHDKRKLFKYATLQSEGARKFLHDMGYQYDDNLSGNDDTIVFYDEGKIYTRSAAIIRIASLLGFPYSMASISKIFPLSYRDRAYNLISRKRYSWFGRKDQCRLPDSATTDRIIG
jgi:predicted DCC family thiol-disulfide oxidoreductase YuxK